MANCAKVFSYTKWQAIWFKFQPTEPPKKPLFWPYSTTRGRNLSPGQHRPNCHRLHDKYAKLKDRDANRQNPYLDGRIGIVLSVVHKIKSIIRHFFWFHPKSHDRITHKVEFQVSSVGNWSAAHHI